VIHVLIAMIECGTGRMQLSCACLARAEFGHRQSITGPPRGMSPYVIGQEFKNHIRTAEIAARVPGSKVVFHTPVVRSKKLRGADSAPR
jgi:hypothetical protein